MPDPVTVFGSAGTTIAIGTKAADATADTYVEIGEVTNWPEFGPNFEVVSHTPISSRSTVKLKGARNDGRLDLTYAVDFADAGQDAARTAFEDVSRTSGDYNFKVTLADSAGGTGDTPTIFYIRGGVFAFTFNPGDVNSVMGGTLGIEINGAITIVEAVDAT